MKAINLKFISQGSFYPLDTIGGKAFNLQFLANRGLPIPETYVIDSQDIENIDGQHDFLERVFDLLDDNKLYAVRSSGVNEDGLHHSYAGMFDSFLNVAKHKLGHAVILCANSIKNIRLAFYEKKLGLLSNHKMAVVIQEMVDANYSGVCFTAHPVTNDTSKIVIELTSGYGDKLVSGEITPLTMVIDKPSFAISEIYEGDFDVSLIPYLQLLVPYFCEVFLKIEEHYGYPVDIEWATEKDKLYILQTRPITVRLVA